MRDRNEHREQGVVRTIRPARFMNDSAGSERGKTLAFLVDMYNTVDISADSVDDAWVSVINGVQSFNGSINTAAHYCSHGEHTHLAAFSCY